MPPAPLKALAITHLFTFPMTLAPHLMTLSLAVSAPAVLASPKPASPMAVGQLCQRGRRDEQEHNGKQNQFKH